MMRKGMSETARLSRETKTKTITKTNSKINKKTKTITKTNTKANTSTICNLCKSGGTGDNDEEEIGDGEVENERIGELPQGGGAHDRGHHQQRPNRCNLIFHFSVAHLKSLFFLFFLAHQDDGDVEQQEELGQLAFDSGVFQHVLSHITGRLLS